MNIVTIHPQPKKALTFADIPPGPFFWNGHQCTKIMLPGNAFNAVRRDGALLAMQPADPVTLPDAPPEDDTVPYGDLKAGEMFKFMPNGDPLMMSDEEDGDGMVQSINLVNGDIVSYLPSARVGRVHSVTITKEKP